MIKKFITLLAACALCVQFAGAQEDRGEQTAAAPLPEKKTEVVAVAVSEGKSSLKEAVVVEDKDKWWSVKASTGWDSLYMFRGVNILGNGNGIYWLSGSVGVDVTGNDAITAGVWYGVGTGAAYHEFDLTVDYTHNFGPVAASFGWAMYAYPTYLENNNYYQNEIYWKLACEKELGPVTVIPSATYYLELGPTINDPNGVTQPGSSYLLLRLDASMDIYKEIVSLAPWTAFGVTFDYNTNSSGEFIRGGNNWELGLSVPVQITEWASISGYVAYSHQWMDLYNTDPSTVWAGASVNFSF